MSKIKVKTVSLLERYFSGNSMNWKQIVSIFLPLLVDQIFVVCLNMLNTAMVSSSGIAAVSAVSMVDSLNLFLLNVFIAIATGGTVIVAQYKGVNDDNMMSKSAAQALTAVAVLSVLLSTLLLIFRDPTLAFLFGKADQDVLNNATTYMIASYASYPCFAIYQAVCGVLRGASDTKSSLILSMITNFSYVILNVFLVTLSDLGVMGLSVSLNISRALGMICSIIYLIRYNHTLHIKVKDIFHFDFSIQKKILFIGIPFAAEQLFFNGGKLLTQTFIVQLGTLSMTIYAICNSLIVMFQIAANAIQLTAITVVGQCVGRQDIDDAKKFTKSLVGISCISFIVADLILLPAFPLLIRLFSPPEEIISTIFIIYLLTAIVQPLTWSPSFVTPSALRAAGDSKFTSIASLLSMWLFRVVMGYIFGIILPFGIIGVWCAMLLEWGVRTVIFFLRFRGTKWYRHKLI